MYASYYIPLYCNTQRVRIWISMHYTSTYTYTYFNIFFYYKIIHSIVYQSTSTKGLNAEEIIIRCKRLVNLDSTIWIIY